MLGERGEWLNFIVSFIFLSMLSSTDGDYKFHIGDYKIS